VIVRLPRPPVLVGHSMGGRIVQDVTARYPAAGAVFVASVGPRHDLAFLGNLIRREPVMFLRNLLPSPPPPRPNPSYLFGDAMPDALARGHIARLQPESTLAALQIAGPHRFRRGEQPVLVLTGEQDRTLSIADSRRLARAYGVECHVLDGLGHELMLEQRWEEPLAVVERWLGEAVVAD
jgi:pimeloyl-ACP methyl ester carboxylesterase